MSHPGTKGLGVLVIGMHRSGTSAVTAMLTQLGLNPPRADDLLPPSPWNERGNGESKSLVELNDRLLGELGGSWSAPPELSSRWASAGSLAGLKTEAFEVFTSTAGAWPFAWKDPRNCILMPFWTSVIGSPVAAVFVYREPLEVARSLQARNHFPVTHGLALWERYVRTAAANLAGFPTIAVEFTQVLSEPAAWCHQLVEFLASVDVSVDPERVTLAAGSSESRLVHQRSATDAQGGLVEGPRAVLATLKGLQGAHFPWSQPDLGVEPSWVADVLTLRRELEQARRDRESARSSGLGQVARAARRTGTRISREALSRLGDSSRRKASPPPPPPT
jgi:hypothetical protein